jgi:hypothetical protein
MVTNDDINQQIERIETEYKRVSGRDVTPMQRVHDDDKQLQWEQYKTIADWLEHLTPTQTQSPDNGVLAQAQALIASGSWTKADMEAVLNGDLDG